MKIIVDTSVWSHALRRKQESTHAAVDQLKELLLAGESIFYLGVILTEILQAVSSDTVFRQIEKQFDSFDLIELSRNDYVCAAKLATRCRVKGIHAGTIDFLIASAAIEHDCWLHTVDTDFVHIAKICPLKLLT
jgi:hypothetical protein